VPERFGVLKVQLELDVRAVFFTSPNAFCGWGVGILDEERLG